MRFPINLPLMSRLKKLFNHDKIKDNIKLLDFKFASDNGMGYYRYNGTGIRKKDLPNPLGDVFHFSQVGVSTAKPDYFNPSAGYDNICKDVIHDFVYGLEQDLEHGGNKGWLNLRSKDGYSTRAYMSMAYKPNANLKIGPEDGGQEIGLPDDVINWCESMDKSTGWYDRAFSETVLEAMAFGASSKPEPIDPEWKCLE